MKTKLCDCESDRGFSLTELAVYILVLGIISAVIATVVVSLFRSEQTVSGVTNASNDSQVVSAMLDRDIRNARALQIGPNSVVASVAGSDTTSHAWNCVRWEVTDSSATEESMLTREVFGDTGSVPSWGTGTALATGVQHVGTAPYFSGASTVTTVPVQNGMLQYAFALPTTGDATLDVTGQLSNRVTAAGSRCW